MSKDPQCLIILKVGGKCRLGKKVTKRLYISRHSLQLEQCKMMIMIKVRVGGWVGVGISTGYEKKAGKMKKEKGRGETGSRHRND
jgi:hypothetical protein